MVKAIEQTKSDIAVSSIIQKKFLREKYKLKITNQKTFSFLPEKIRICDIPNNCDIGNKLYKLELIKNNKFDNNLLFEDIFWLPEIIKKAKKIVTVPNVNQYYFENKNLLTENIKSKKVQKDLYLAKRYMVKFFRKNNLELAKKHQKYVKSIKFTGNFQLLKTKEYKNKEHKYLFGFLKIPSIFLNLLHSIRIFFKSILSFNVIDYHFIINFFGFLISKKFTPPERRRIILRQRGVTSIKRKPRIIASLTTCPEKINIVKETIKTLLAQTLQPDEVVLWLASEQFPQGENSIPGDLLALKEYGLLIKWCNDIKQYKKLIPALKDYKEDIIITFEDDVYYEKDTIEKLYCAYLEDTDCIYTNRAHRIKLNGNKIKPLSKTEIYWTKYDDFSFRNLIMSNGGVLYPPNCFNDEVLNEKVFNKLIPYQDDIWFWAMAVISERKIKVVSGFDRDFEKIKIVQDIDYDIKISKKEGLDIVSKHYPRLITKLKNEYK